MTRKGRGNIRKRKCSGHAIHNHPHLCHANMPNIRIASGFFTRGPRSLDEFRKMEVAMSDDPSQAERKPLTPAAQRALAEAEARRQAAANAKPLPKEFQGPKGPEPTRYGDWEVNGRCSDF